MRTRFRLLLALIATLALIASCAADVPGVYRGGQLMQAGPLDIQEHYSYRFVDKWRISHQWLSGPVELRGCQGYGSNSFNRLGGYGALGIENMEPLIELKGILYSIYEHKGKFEIGSTRENIYGTNRDGKFEGFSAFCQHVFSKDSYDGLGLYIVKPDPAKGTDEWVEGAQPITINGLHWLHKKIPIQDWSQNRERSIAPIEIWVLKIPRYAVLDAAAFFGKFGHEQQIRIRCQFLSRKTPALARLVSQNSRVRQT